MAKGAMTSSTGLSAIVLAAGKGTRMKSQLPKVLHPLCGRPLLEYPVTAAFEAGADQVVVVTSGQPEITRALTERYGDERNHRRVQEPPRGTGDAVRVGLGAVKHARTLILYGDTPLLRAQDLSGLIAALDVAGKSWRSDGRPRVAVRLRARPARPVGRRSRSARRARFAERPGARHPRSERRHVRG